MRSRTLILLTVLLALLAGSAVAWLNRDLLAPWLPLAGDGVIGLDCGVNESEQRLCEDLVARFEAETGIDVEIKNAPENASLHLAVLQELGLTRSTDVDVYMVDVIWPGIVAEHVIDLSRVVSDEDLADFFPRLIESNTVGGRLLAIPWYTDAGLLYYRSDLLGRYGFDGPPATWAELETMARTVQEGERAAGNPDFWGYVWQGDVYEGLTCDALEWIRSNGGGGIVDADGEITVNNAAASEILDTAAGWVGTISPERVTRFTEPESLEVWLAGNAAFMRNWPYAYARSNEIEALRGNFDAAPLPAGAAGPAATLGGWQLAVSRYSRDREEAVALVRYLTSAESQKLRAIEGSYNPTRRSLYTDPEVLAANPFFARMPPILDAAVARPSGVTGGRYNEVSKAFHSEVHQVLTGELTGAEAVAAIERQLVEIRGEGW